MLWKGHAPVNAADSGGGEVKLEARCALQSRQQEAALLHLPDGLRVILLGETRARTVKQAAPNLPIPDVAKSIHLAVSAAPRRAGLSARQATLIPHSPPLRRPRCPAMSVTRQAFKSHATVSVDKSVLCKVIFRTHPLPHAWTCYTLGSPLPS